MFQMSEYVTLTDSNNMEAASLLHKFVWTQQPSILTKDGHCVRPFHDIESIEFIIMTILRVTIVWLILSQAYAIMYSLEGNTFLLPLDWHLSGVRNQWVIKTAFFVAKEKCS